MDILQKDIQTTHPRWSVLVLSLAVVLMGCVMLSGCTEEEPGVEETTTTSLQITPRIQIDGLDELNADMFLQGLSLGVGAIYLEPMDRDGVVYISHSSMFLNFDLATGETVVEGTPITLPHSGEYLISLHLEPMSGEGLNNQSVRLDGLLAQPTEKPSTKDEPMPLPWLVQNDNGTRLPDGLGEKPVNWVPWTYASERTTTLSLNNVEFSNEDEQTLVISLDLFQWLDSALEPIHAAVQDRTEDHPDLVTTTENIAPIDVSSDIENNGSDFENLNAWSEVMPRVQE